MIPSLIRASLRQRLIVVAFAVIALMFGIRALTQLSVDAFPDVTNIQVQIATDAVGKSPDEVERLITVPIEIAMTGLPGLEELRSLNKNGLSLITLVFNDDTDVYFARQLVMERMMEVKDKLPRGVTPVLGPVSTGLGEIYQYTLHADGDDKAGELSVEELMARRTVQDWVVRPLLRGIPGVAEINSQGGYQREYHVLADPTRLMHYQISLSDVLEALEKNNANAGGGTLQQHAEQYLVRGLGLIEDLDDIGNIVLKEVDGIPIYIRDVAKVEIGHAVRVGAVIQNGTTEAVGGIVMMIRGGNAKEVVSRIQERVADINDSGMLPDGLKIISYYDRSELVDAALLTVVKVLLEAIVFVIIIVVLFLGDLRSSLIVVGTLLLTPLITFFIMNQVDLSANLMSLGGLAIAIGLMVDGSVVVVENAYARLGDPANKNESRLRVIFNAASEVATPVVFGVGIIILVFLPLMTLEGMEGKMFAPLAYTIAIALAVSLVLSLTLTPVLASYMLKGGAEHDTRLVAFLKKPYTKLLNWALSNEKKVIAASLAILAGTFVLFGSLGTAFIPEMREGSIVPNVFRLPNIGLNESIEIEKQATKLMSEVPGVKSVVSGLGRGESPADPQSQNESTPIVSLLPRDEWPEGWNQDTIAEEIRKKLSNLHGTQIVMSQPIAARVNEMVTGVRADVAVKIFGDDLMLLKKKADEIAKVASAIQGSQDIRVERVTGQQYLDVDIHRKIIARHGLNVADVQAIIETAIGGKVATQIYEGERRFNMVLRFPVDYRNDVEAIRDIQLISPNGAKVPLRELADVEVRDGPAQISRENAKRRIVIGINVADRDLGGFVAELQQKVNTQVKLPEGYYYEWGGQFQNMSRAMSHLMVIIPITVAAIFFLLFLLFSSLRMASLIMLVLPFASVGGVVALWITGEYLSVPASVGFIALWGIAVLNGVVLVTYIRSLIDEGIERVEALKQACQQRFRPVMMTGTVAMLGLIPFLFATGPGSEVQKPLAIVVIGGLITSTLLTLVVLPTLYRFFEEPRHEA
jgi:cobalt-zinc-cadmium resistance protein CzcA